MCLPVAAALSSSEVSGAAFKLYACYCAHREGFEANVKNEQIHAETGLGYAYISTLKYELLEAGWIGLSNKTAKGIIPLKGFEGAAEHIRPERKLSKIERTSDKKSLNIERKSGEVSKVESSETAPEKLSKNERMLSDDISINERNQTTSFENQKEISGTPLAPSKAKNTSTEREANASRAAGAASLKSYIGRLLQFRENHLGTKLPAHKTEAAAAKWLFEQGWAFEDVTACHDFLVGQGRTWRGSAVTLNAVMSAIAEWKKGNLSDGTRTEPRPQRQSRADILRDERDYSVFRPGGGGVDAGGDSRPVPILAGVATPQKR